MRLCCSKTWKWKQKADAKLKAEENLFALCTVTWPYIPGIKGMWLAVDLSVVYFQGSKIITRINCHGI